MERSRDDIAAGAVTSSDRPVLPGIEWFGGPTRAAGVVRVLASFALFALAWEILARTLVTNRLILVPFSEVMASLAAESASGELWTNARVTLLELAIAFPIAAAIGVGLGMVLASSRLLQQLLDPTLTALYSVPIVALAPLVIAWLGLGIESKIAIVLLTTVFPVIINTEAGIRAADPAFVEAAKSFNASRSQIYRTVTLPFAVPFIIGGLRVAFARALVGVIVAEFFGSFAGFGNAIQASGQTFQTARLLGYVVVLALIGMAGSVGLQAWERKLAPWRHQGDE